MKNKIVFPKIGLRIIKSAFAVFLCLMLDILLRLLNKSFATTFYNPFFAGLATVYSMNSSKEDSIKLAKIRTIGSIIGGAFGAIILFLTIIILEKFGLEQGNISFDIVRYTIVSILTIGVIYFTLVVKKKEVTFIALLTYLSVAVGNRSEIPPIFFALNRSGSTIIGVLISLAVNLFSIHFRKNSNITFVTAIDGLLIHKDNNRLSNFQKFHLNNLIYDKLNIIFASSRTPATIIDIFEDINVKNEVIIMNGSATFDLNKEEFHNIVHIKQEVRLLIDKYFEDFDLNHFTHIIKENSLQIYYTSLDNPGEKSFFEHRRGTYFRNYAKGEAPEDEEVVFYTFINTKEICQKVLEDINKLDVKKKLYVAMYKSLDNLNFYTIKISSSNSNKYAAFKKIQKDKPVNKIIAIVSSITDISLIKHADYSYCFIDAEEEIKELVSEVLPIPSGDNAVKELKKLYYKKVDFNKN